MKKYIIKIHEGSDDHIQKRYSVSILGLSKRDAVNIKNQCEEKLQ